MPMLCCVIDGGKTKLPHIPPSIHELGWTDLTNPLVLLCVALGKLVAIGACVLGGYRGGFIFPFSKSNYMYIHTKRIVIVKF